MTEKKTPPPSNENSYPDGRRLEEAVDGFQPFPEPTDVFANPVDEHSRFLLPVATVDLARVGLRESGVVQLVIPLEPCDGMLGEFTPSFHNAHCFEDWLSYRMEGDRCEFLADFRYFHLEMLRQDGSKSQELNELEEHYQRVRVAYELRRDFFRQQGWLHRNPAEYDTDDPHLEWRRAELIDDLGGTSFDGNWSHNGWESSLPINRYPDANRFPLTQHGDQACTPGRVVPRTPDGRDYIYIGSISMWNYIGDTNGAMLYFYDPGEQIVTSVIDWT